MWYQKFYIFYFATVQSLKGNVTSFDYTILLSICSIYSIVSWVIFIPLSFEGFATHLLTDWFIMITNKHKRTLCGVAKFYGIYQIKFSFFQALWWSWYRLVSWLFPLMIFWHRVFGRDECISCQTTILTYTIDFSAPKSKSFLNLLPWGNEIAYLL